VPNKNQEEVPLLERTEENIPGNFQINFYLEIIISKGANPTEKLTSLGQIFQDEISKITNSGWDQTRYDKLLAW
jgi:hypothetical protein